MRARARTALFKPGTTLSKLIGRIRFTIDVAEMTRRTRIDPRRGGGPVLPSLALEICIRYRFYYPQFPFYVSCCRSVDRSSLGVAIFNSIPGDPARRVPPEVSLISPDTLSRVNQRSPNSAERKATSDEGNVGKSTAKSADRIFGERSATTFPRQLSRNRANLASRASRANPARAWEPLENATIAMRASRCFAINFECERRYPRLAPAASTRKRKRGERRERLAPFPPEEDSRTGAFLVPVAARSRL